MNIKQKIQNILSQAVLDVYDEKLDSLVDIILPPSISMGDFAIGCFEFATRFKKSPNQIAEDLVSHMKDDVATFKAVGPYINITLHNEEYFSSVITDQQTLVKNKQKTVMIEYLSPNTNKPLHLGHIRNGVIGMALSHIIEETGDTVVKANLVNNRGVHICKSMLAWQKWGEGKTPETENKKGDHFVGDYYVLYAKKVKENPSLDIEIQDMLKKWEDGDEEVMAIWSMMNEWVYAGWKDTYEKLGFTFDVEYYESDIYKKGKDLVFDALEKGIFEKAEDGAVVYNLSKEDFGVGEDGLHRKVAVLRKDGTSVYSTQDIATSAQKTKDYDLDASIYVVANEQEYYFKTLFEIFKALGYDWADKCYHLSYGMVELPTGKMKSREGTVVDADDLIEDVVELTKEAIVEKHGDELTKEEVEKRAYVIALGAIKFFFLRSGSKSKIIFSPKESIAFEGVTGPYCQYAYARAMSLEKKVLSLPILDGEINYSLLGKNDEERILAQRIYLFNSVIEKSAVSYNPTLVAMAVYDLASAFHKFYDKHKVVGDGVDEDLTRSRLALVQITAKTLKRGLGLLGVDVLEQM